MFSPHKPSPAKQATGPCLMRAAMLDPQTGPKRDHGEPQVVVIKFFDEGDTNVALPTLSGEAALEGHHSFTPAGRPCGGRRDSLP